MNQSVEFMSYEDQVAATRARRIRLGLDRPVPVVVRPPPPPAVTEDPAKPKQIRRSDIAAVHAAMIADIGKGRFDKRVWKGDQPTELVESYEVVAPPREPGESPICYARRLCHLNGTTLDRLRLKDHHAMTVRVRWGVAAALWRAGEDGKGSLSEIGRILSRDHTTVLSALRKMRVK